MLNLALESQTQTPISFLNHIYTFEAHIQYGPQNNSIPRESKETCCSFWRNWRSLITGSALICYDWLPICRPSFEDRKLNNVNESESVVLCPLGNLVSKPPFWMTMTMMKILRIDDGVDVIFDRAFVVLSHDLSKHFCEKCQTHSQSCIFVMNLGKVLLLQRSGGIIVKDSKNPTLPKVFTLGPITEFFNFLLLLSFFSHF